MSLHGRVLGELTLPLGAFGKGSEVGRQMAVAIFVKDLGERVVFAEVVASGAGEIESVVPLATRILESLEAAGGLGGGGVVRENLGEVAGGFRGFADVMQFVLGEATEARLGSRKAALGQSLGDAHKLWRGERGSLGRLQRGEQARSGAGSLGLVGAQKSEQVFGGVDTLCAEMIAELRHVFEQGGRLRRGFLAEVAFRVFRQVVELMKLYVEVAHGAGGAAQLAQDTLQFRGVAIEVRQRGKGGQLGEQGANAAGLGAQPVHGLLGRVGQAGGKGSLEGGDVFADRDHGVERSGLRPCLWFGSWPRSWFRSWLRYRRAGSSHANWMRGGASGRTAFRRRSL